MSEKIINPKKPSKKDLLILEWMDAGNTIDSARALGLFKTTGLRDCLYRLRKAGHIILHRDISYKTKEGENKYYRQWFTKVPKILQSGIKTEHEKNVYKKGEKALTDYTREISASSANSVTISRQGELFPA